jgi:predicted ATPase/class 3 adenylate cyclase
MAGSTIGNYSTHGTGDSAHSAIRSPFDVPPDSTEDVDAAARAAYGLLVSLVRIASERIPAGAQAAAAAFHLALRSTLAPVLAPYLADPLRPLGGQFVSVDAQIQALLGRARSDAAAALAPDLVAGLTPADREALASISTRDAARDMAIDAPAGSTFATSLVGAAWGSLYLPASGIAVPCRVWAVYDAAGARNALSESRRSRDAPRWPFPRSVRPVSPDIRSASFAAQAAALAVVERFSDALLSAPLWPGPLYFDVCCSDTAAVLDDAVVGAVVGESLGLPLALAFLSALISVPVIPGIGATGALGSALGGQADVGAVRPVGWAPAKAAAHAARFPGSVFLAPAAEPATVTVADVAPRPVHTVVDAASAAMEGFADRIARAAALRPYEDVDAPVGERVAFLRTEVEGSVRLWQDVPEVARQIFGDYEAIFRNAVRAHRGVTFGTGGGADGAATAAFSHCADACSAALGVQQGVLIRLWPVSSTGIRIRAAVHCGPADLFHGEYFGAAVAQLARLCEAANPGQILLSDAARRAASGSRDAGDRNWILTDLGRHRLRDLGEPLPLFQLNVAADAAESEAPRTLEGRSHNLPIQLTSFVGRETELEMLRTILLAPDVGASGRLISLYGPGGVGKTRLALQAGAECAASTEVAAAGYDGGVWFVALSEARSAADVVASIAETLRAPTATAGRSLTEQVVAAMDAAPGRTLLILDNLETALPDAAAIVAGLLRQTSRCTILVTTQVLLGVRGERRFEVAPLHVPTDSEAHTDAEIARGSAAVALFRARARDANDRFDRPREDGGSGVASVPLLCSVCRKLDGLPLAIELAAARARYLALAELEQRLDDAFSILVTRSPDIPERHRTLLNTLQWSYDLLDAREQRFLARLSVFAGGFTEAAATAVTGEVDALDLLSSLEEKSLVRCELLADGPDAAPGDHGDTRFSLLHMIQTFARRRLDELGLWEETARAHARYYEELANLTVPALDTPDEVRLFDRLNREMDNLRAAYMTLSAVHPPSLPRFVVAMGEFARCRGHGREWIEWPRQALDIVHRSGADAFDPVVVGRLHLAHATGSRDLGGDLEPAECAVRAALHCAGIRDAEDREAVRLRADALNVRGLILLNRKDPACIPDAVTAFESARSLYVSLDYGRGQIRALNNLGFAAGSAQEPDVARRYFRESEQLCRRLDQPRGLYHALCSLGQITVEERDYTTARAQFIETLHLGRALRDTTLTAVALLNVGDVIGLCGDPATAVHLLVATEQIFDRLGHRYRASAAAYIARYAKELPDLGTRVDELRRDAQRASLAALLATDPARQRRLAVQPTTITLAEEPATASGASSPPRD